MDNDPRLVRTAITTVVVIMAARSGTSSFLWPEEAAAEESSVLSNEEREQRALQWKTQWAEHEETSRRQSPGAVGRG